MHKLHRFYSRIRLSQLSSVDRIANASFKEKRTVLFEIKIEGYILIAKGVTRENAWTWTMDMFDIDWVLVKAKFSNLLLEAGLMMESHG